MKKTLKYSFVIFALALGLSTAAHATPGPTAVPPKAAPEVDPALVVSGVALLGGTLTLLRTRRRK